MAFGPQGQVVEFVSPDGVLTQIDATGAHTLGGSVRSANVAFGPAGETLVVVFRNGMLAQFDAMAPAMRARIEWRSGAEATPLDWHAYTLLCRDNLAGCDLWWVREEAG